MAKVISVRISEEDLNKISLITKNEGLSRNAFIIKAIRNFINNYDMKNKPDAQVQELTNKIIELAKNYDRMSVRLNILTRQVDKLINAKKLDEYANK